VAIFVSIRTRQKALQFQIWAHKSNIRLEQFRSAGRDRLIHILDTIEDALLEAMQAIKFNQTLDDIFTKLEEQNMVIAKGFVKLRLATNALDKSEFNRGGDWADVVDRHEDIILAGKFERAYEAASAAQARDQVEQTIRSFQTLSASLHERIETEIEAFSEDAD